MADGEDKDSNDENNSQNDYPDIEECGSSDEYGCGNDNDDDDDEEERDKAERKKFDMEFFERLKRQK